MMKSIMNYLTGKIDDSDPYNSVTVDSDRSLRQVSKSISKLSRPVTHKQMPAPNKAGGNRGLDFIGKLSSDFSSSITGLETTLNSMIKNDLNPFEDEESRPLSTKALKHRKKYTTGWD